MPDPLTQPPPALAETPPSGFKDLIGYRLVTWREGYAEVALDVADKHLNIVGIPHGGVLATLLDTASGYAGCWCSVPGNQRRAVTLSLTTQFIGQARAGTTLTASARTIGGGRRIFFTRAEVHDAAGQLVAHGEGVFRYRSGSESVEGYPADRPGPGFDG
jgi:uncharacterized protein (TIGR00369 family)